MVSIRELRQKCTWLPAIAGIAFLVLHIIACTVFGPLTNIHEAPAPVSYAWFLAAIMTLLSSILVIPKWQSFFGFAVVLFVFWNIINI